MTWITGYPHHPRIVWHAWADGEHVTLCRRLDPYEAVATLPDRPPPPAYCCGTCLAVLARLQEARP